MDSSLPQSPSSPSTGSFSCSEQVDKNHWGAVALVAAATFIVVAAEMMPVGLLTPMSASLFESEGTVGFSLTITGLVAAITAPFVPIVTGRIDRRATLIVLMLVVAVANALTALAENFTVLAVARVLLGVSMGGVWALAASLAPKLVAARFVGVGTTVIFSGVAVASVLGVPLGAYTGAAVGWNAAFWGLAAAAVAISLSMACVLPAMPSSAATPLNALAVAFRNPGVRRGLAITGLLVSAHFAAFTYVRPTLETFAGLDGALIGTMLLIYGTLGIVGNFASGPIADRKPKVVVIVLTLGIAGTLALVPSFATTALAAAVLVGAWGLFYGGVSVSTQVWIAHAASDHRESVSALWVSVFNASIALGAFTGGKVLDNLGSGAVLWISAGIAAIALVLASTGKA